MLSPFLAATAFFLYWESNEGECCALCRSPLREKCCHTEPYEYNFLDYPFRYTWILNIVLCSQQESWPYCFIYQFGTWISGCKQHGRKRNRYGQDPRWPTFLASTLIQMLLWICCKHFCLRNKDDNVLIHLYFGVRWIFFCKWVSHSP